VQFTDATHGWMYGCLGPADSGNCALLRTTDAARTWSTLPVSQQVLALAFRNERSGWLLALQEGHLTVLSTADGDATLHWAAHLPLAYDANLPSPPAIVALSAVAGYVVEGSEIAVTSDGWKTFAVRTAPAGADNAVSFLSSSVGFAAPPGGIDETMDGGLSWHTVFPTAGDAGPGTR
jgi:photosystem II stability/assembly factor-like uncharacterized protein